MRQVGVATSSMQFLRSIGGSIGAAGFGAVLSNRFAAGLSERLTADVTAGLRPSMFATLANPQALMNPSVAAQLRNADPDVVSRMQPVVQAVRGALSVSLHDVFLTGALMSLLGLVFALLLIDIPRRQSNRRAAPALETA